MTSLYVELFDMVLLVAKKVILMHIMGVKNFDDVLPKIFALSTQIQPQGFKEAWGLMPHTYSLMDLNEIVEWALWDKMTLIDVMYKGTIISLHSNNAKNNWRWF